MVYLACIPDGVLGAGGQSHGGCSGNNGLRKVWESSEQVLGVFLNPLRPGGLSSRVTMAGGSQAIATVLGGGAEGEACWNAYGTGMGQVWRANEDGENFSSLEERGGWVKTSGQI